MSYRTFFIKRDEADEALATALDTISAADAETALRQALNGDEARHGADHVNTAISLNNLAGLLLETGRASEALPLAARCRDILLSATPSDHPARGAAYQTFVAIVRQLDAEAALPPQLRPFAAQMRVTSAPTQTTQTAPPPPPRVEQRETPIAPRAEITEPEPPRRSPLGAIGNFIFGARPPKRR